MTRLSKPESRERWRQARDLWNAFDPIGVMPMEDWPRDEYEGYLGPTLRLLESGANLSELEQYLKKVTLEHMGLTETPARAAARRQFAETLRLWYEQKWSGTVV